jgi:hypothetical protein
LVGKFDHNSKIGRKESKDTMLHKFSCTHLGSNLYLGFFCGVKDLSIPLMFPMMLMCWGQNTINRNWPKCNHSLCDYMWLLVICNYIWTFLQLFLVLVIFAITMQLVCNYFGVHLSMWITFSLVFIQEKQFMSH